MITSKIAKTMTAGALSITLVAGVLHGENTPARAAEPLPPCTMRGSDPDTCQIPDYKVRDRLIKEPATLGNLVIYLTAAQNLAGYDIDTLTQSEIDAITTLLFHANWPLWVTTSRLLWGETEATQKEREKAKAARQKAWSNILLEASPSVKYDAYKSIPQQELKRRIDWETNGKDYSWNLFLKEVTAIDKSIAAKKAADEKKKQEDLKKKQEEQLRKQQEAESKTLSGKARALSSSFNTDGDNDKTTGTGDQKAQLSGFGKPEIQGAIVALSLISALISAVSRISPNLFAQLQQQVFGLHR